MSGLVAIQKRTPRASGIRSVQGDLSNNRIGKKTPNLYSVVIIHGTTGNKLQGESMDALVIAEWSKVKNWACVVLSSVRSLAGLFLIKPIPTYIDFEPAGDYVDMMIKLWGTISALPQDSAELKAKHIIGNLKTHNIIYTTISVAFASQRLFW
jgi:hypothetical protein